MLDEEQSRDRRYVTGECRLYLTCCELVTPHRRVADAIDSMGTKLSGRSIGLTL